MLLFEIVLQVIVIEFKSINYTCSFQFRSKNINQKTKIILKTETKRGGTMFCSQSKN